MNIPLKPLGESLGWTVLSSDIAFECPWFSVRRFEILRKEVRGTYTYVEHPGSVLIVPVTPNGNYVLIRAYRFTTDSWSWEVPAGTLADSHGLDVQEVAMKELSEEVGATCEQLEPLGNFGLTNGSAQHTAHFFLAHGVRISATPHLDHLEEIGEAREFSADEIIECIADGSMRDGDSVFALLLARVRLAGK